LLPLVEVPILGRERVASGTSPARVRYRALLTAALRRIAADPQGLSSVARDTLLTGLRSFHIRHSRDASREAPVAHFP
jgi:toxin ParE1/3/4